MDLRQKLESTLGDSYTVERELGGGGMARVFLAVENSLGRYVVVKIIGPDLVAGIRGERFAREVKLAASLQHPNIVPVLATGVADGIPYYTMPYVKGDSLLARMSDPQKLSLRQSIAILRDVARALSFAHREGVVHRDIKPGNVLLSGDAAVVTDFGIAKAISAAQTSQSGDEEETHTPTTLTQAGSSIGTPAYMAPEQCAGDVVDNRADIYAWGVLAYQLLSGEHPFAGKPTAAQLMVAQISQTPVSLSEKAPGVPAAVAAIVMKCLEKLPEKRPSSASEIVEVLETPHESRDYPSMTAPSIRKRRNTIVWASAAAALLIAAIGGYAWSKRGAAASESLSSVAVLPFDHDAADSAEAYLGEGIADELMTALGKVPGLRVASRTSSIAVGKRNDLDVREIASRLGVASVVEGTIRRSGDRLRVTAQLTNASDGLTMWSDAYDRENKDVFAVQADIAQAIANALRPKASGGAAIRGAVTSGPGTSDPEAYDLYMRGLYLVERRGPSLARAVEYFNQAILKDPNFARAYAGLAGALEFYPYFLGTPAHTVEQRAQNAANRALALDPSLAEPRVALAMAHWHSFRWNEADLEFRKAIDTDSTSAVARTQYGRFLLSVARVPEAVTQLRAARRLDPLAPTSYVWLSEALSYNGMRAEAEEVSRRSRELEPNLLTNRTIVIFNLVRWGKHEEALSIMRGLDAIVPFDGMTAFNRELAGDKAGAGQLRARLERMPDTTWMVHSGRAWGHLSVGDTARALTEMEQAVESREMISSYIPFCHWMYDSIRQTPRFAQIVRRLGLEGRGLTSPTGGRPAP